MHDMIGTTGMVQGWIAVWHSAVLWIVPAFVVSVVATGLLEARASARGVRLCHPTKPLLAALQGTIASQASVAVTGRAFTESKPPGSIATHGAD
jgi:anti-sigma-K factor RskA